MNCRFMIQFSQTPIFYYWYCSVHSVEFFSTASLNRDAGLERDAALIAMRCFGARRGATKTSCTNMTMRESTTGKGEIR